ncbi:MAG: hypothetical protein ABIH67_04600 [Candidatus Uhrbacteria bacterium]
MDTLEIIRLIDHGLVVQLGRDGKSNRYHLLFYSEPDRQCYVAVRDGQTREVITILPLDYHNKWVVSDQAQAQAKDLAMGRIRDKKVIVTGSTLEANLVDKIPQGQTIFRFILLIKDRRTGKMESRYLGEMALIGAERKGTEAFADDLFRIELYRKISGLRLPAHKIPEEMILKLDSGRSYRKCVPDNLRPKQKKGPQLICSCILQTSGDPPEKIVSLDMLSVADVGMEPADVLKNSTAMAELKSRLVCQIALGQRPIVLKIKLGPHGPESLFAVPDDWKRLYHRG